MWYKIYSRIMRLRYILIGIISLFMLVALFTCPSKEKHIDSVIIELQLLEDQQLNEGSFDFMRESIIRSYTSSTISYKNYGLFSIAIDFKTIGIFNNIFINKK